MIRARRGRRRCGPDRTAPAGREVVLLGKTGAGKTSIANAVFGTELHTDAVVAATCRVHRIRTEPQRDGCDLVVVDTPGFAAREGSLLRHPTVYRAAMASATTVLWAVQAQPPVLAPDEEALAILAGAIGADVDLVVAVTHVDTIGPDGWGAARNTPSHRQRTELAGLIGEVMAVFRTARVTFGPDDVIPCAVGRGYGVAPLRARILSPEPVRGDHHAETRRGPERLDPASEQAG